MNYDRRSPSQTFLRRESSPIAVAARNRLEGEGTEHVSSLFFPLGGAVRALNRHNEVLAVSPMSGLTAKRNLL